MRYSNLIRIIRFMSLFLIICLVIVSLRPLFHYAQDSQEIPVELVKKVAEYQAHEKWGEVQVGPTETYYGLDGIPMVYVFTIYKGKDSIPTNGIILGSVHDARKVRITAEEHLKKIATVSDWSEIKKARQELEDAWKNIRQTEKFGTLIISANSDHPPVITIYDGLAPHFSSLEDAKEVAIKELNVSDINIHKLLYLGNMVFVFQFSNGLKNVFVNAMDLRPLSDETIKAIANTARSSEQIARSKEKWLRLKQILNYSEEQK